MKSMSFSLKLMICLPWFLTLCLPGVARGGEASPPEESCVARFAGAPSGTRSQCLDWKRNQNPLLQSYPNGEVLPNPAHLETRPLPRQLVQATRRNPNRRSLEGLREAIGSLKRTMIEQITGGTPQEKWNDHQRYLVDRLDNLTIDFKESCEGPLFNASYSAPLNQLQVCPLLTHLPFEASLPLIAHELGHLADPCNYTDRFGFAPSLMTNGRSDPQKIRMQVARCLNQAGVAREKVDAFLSFAVAPTRLAAQGLTYFAAQREENAPINQALVKCNLISPPTLAAPNSYGGSPYFSVLQCVGENYPNQGRPGAGTRLTPNSVVPAPTDTGSACDNTHVKTKECTADHIGTALVDAHLARHRSQLSRPELLSYFYASVHCAEGGAPVDDYSSSVDRARIFYQSTEVRQALQCGPDRQRPVCSLPDLLRASLGRQPTPASGAR